MADQLINDKFYNVSFDTILSSSDAKFATTRLFKTKERIPHRLKHGSSSKENGGFFDESLINSNDQLKIVKLSGSFNYVGLRVDVYKTMVVNFMSSSASSTIAFQQMSASFFNSGGFGNALSTSSYVTLIVEDNEGGIISPSYTPTPSGIVNASGHLDITISNTSDFNTAATWSFAPGGGGNELHQTSSINSFSHRLFYTGSNLNGIALSGSESGSITGVGNIEFVNNVDSEDGTYLQYLIKGKVYGDGEFETGEVSSSNFTNTSSVVFLPIKEIIIYSGSTNIKSGSFKYHSSSLTLASSSGTSTTLFYQLGTNGPSGSYTGSGALSGSHIYLNNTLTTPASSGYYAVPNNPTQILYAFRGGVNSDLTGTSSAAVGQIEYQVPRLTSSSILS